MSLRYFANSFVRASRPTAYVRQVHGASVREALSCSSSKYRGLTRSYLAANHRNIAVLPVPTWLMGMLLRGSSGEIPSFLFEAFLELSHPFFQRVFTLK